MGTLAERMLALFAGYDAAHGTYAREERNDERPEKLEIKRTARTGREPVTAELWEAHLSGQRPLGVIPIRDDNSCVWGCVDVDRYDLSLADLWDECQRLKLPVSVCRSKSGGAYIFLLMAEPVSASLMVSKLREVAAALKCGDCELFPKQTEVKTDSGELGNWLNMPYFGAETKDHHAHFMSSGQRYAVRHGGMGLTLREFLDQAEAHRLSADALRALRVTIKADADLDEGPPCLQHLTTLGFPPGTRNNGLLGLGTLAKKKFPDNWEKVLEDWNQKFMVPPLPSEEVQQVVRGLRRKEYNYRCKDQPLVGCCNSQVCRGRRFGVGAGGVLQAVSSISMLDTQPPLFFVKLTDGGTVECDVDTLLSPRLFQREVLMQLKLVVPQMQQGPWQTHIQQVMASVQIIEAPDEVSTAGHFRELLERFCTDKHAARTRDEILLGKPWRDEAQQPRPRIYFRLRDLAEFLARVKFQDYSRAQITTRVRELGGGARFLNLKGHGTNVFWVPDEFERQTEPHATPQTGEVPI